MKRPPSITVVVLLGVFTAFVGWLLAFANLASQPVQEVRSMPTAEAREPGLVYYVKGSTAGSSRWRTVRNELIRGAAGTARLTEADLNTWARTSFISAGPRKRSDGADEEGASRPTLLGLTVDLTGLNFRLTDDGQLQFAALVEFPKLMPGRRFVYQVRGELEADRRGGLEFNPEEGTIGRAPIVQVPLLGGMLHRRLVGLLLKSPEAASLSENWSSISAVKVENKMIELTLQ